MNLKKLRPSYLAATLLLVALGAYVTPKFLIAAEPLDCANVPSDSEFLRLDAERGNLAAQSQLAYGYAFGRDKNITEAFKWFRKAADQGDAQIQNIMGLAYASHLASMETYGRDNDLAMAREANFADDYIEAAKWFKRAAEQGDNTAKYNLGILYRDGLGVKQDNVEAYFWMFLGTKGHNKHFEKHYIERDEIAKRLSPQELDEVTSRVAAWKEIHEKPKINEPVINITWLMCGQPSKTYSISECGNLLRIARKGVFDAGEEYFDKRTRKRVTSCGWGECQPFRPDWPCGKN